MSFRFLVADCEVADARERRRASVGMTSGEGYAAVLRGLAPGCEVAITTPADPAGRAWRPEALATFDGVVLTGSSLHLYRPSAAAGREVAFMRAVFAGGTPSFGSCAGLQVACVAAGGTVRQMAGRHEAGFARRLWPTEAGRSHPLLRGRPPAWDVPTMHGDEVEQLPEGATLLASSVAVAVQAAEIRHDQGVFWGVQYHPELSLLEVAGALRREADSLVEGGLARSTGELEAHAVRIEALGREPDRPDLSWQLGLGRDITVDELRHTEIRNFIEALVRPTRAARARG